MTRKPSRAAIIRAIVLKDLREITRDRLWAILTPFSLIFMAVVFWILPRTVDETITVGVAPPELASVLEAMSRGSATGASGLEVVTFADPEQLAASVSGELANQQAKDVPIGIAFPPNFMTAVMAGERTTVSVYVDAAIPDEIGQAISSAIREMAYGLRAAAVGKNPLEGLPVSLPEQRFIVLGEDRSGNQVPLREKMRPLLAVMILIMEALALAGLVAVEIQHKTVTALLVTPARTADLLAAKWITGSILAMTQVLFFLFVTGSLFGHWLILLTLMLLASVMMSAVGMISGSAGRDFLSTLFFGLVLVIPLMIPAFASIFPGSPSLWVKLLPSFGLSEAMVRTVSYGGGWAQIAPHIGTTVVWDLLLFGVALVILKKRVEAL